MRINSLKIVAAAMLVMGLFSCKKEKPGGEPSVPEPPVTTVGTPEELSMDSVYLYSKEVYYWNTLIPDYNTFNPRQYKTGNIFKSDSIVLSKIKALQPLDEFSFVTTLAGAESIATGEDKDYGFFVKAGIIDLSKPVTDANIGFFVNYVYDLSPAGVAGVKRGWYINKVNGQTLTMANYSTLLNNLFFGQANSASIEFIKPDGTKVNNTINKATYQANSVLYANVYGLQGSPKKIGYFVFNSFFDKVSRMELNELFSWFKGQNLTDIIVDLRYNGGGSTTTQDSLASILAPASANGKDMYHYDFNQQMQAGNVPLMKKYFGSNISFAKEHNKVLFEKAGSFNFQNIVFIISGSSASASELLINNLKPYANVKIVGDGESVGKPVGYFPIRIGEVAIYPVSFKTLNSRGQEVPYAGFTPDYEDYDGVNFDWGEFDANSGDPLLLSSLNFIVQGSFGRGVVDFNSPRIMSAEKQKIRQMEQRLNKHKFQGMFYEHK